ncbi:MAG: methyl-accepting chemotaxis protein [Candidatus Cyclobacteriaceae bacterium M3_2C_046]
MNFKNLSLGKKMFLAFGTIIFLLILVVFWSTFGISGIVNNAEEVIEGNKLRTDLEHKYVQHLQWASEVNNLLTNEEETQLKVQLDDHKCDFGQWYFGPGRKQAELLIPELAGKFSEFEEPHRLLHASAKQIQEIFIQADESIGASLREAKSDHLIWAHRVKDVCVNAVRIDHIEVEKDPTQCRFGKWLKSSEVKEMINHYPEFGRILDQVKDPHQRLHQSVLIVEKYFRQGDIANGKSYYMDVTKPTTYEVLEVLDQAIAWNDKGVASMKQCSKIFHDQTEVHLNKMGDLFNQTIELSKDYVMTDEVMLTQADQTRWGIITFSTIAIIIGLVLAYVISNALISPILKGVKFARQVASGDLTAEIDVDQKDEIGQLAQALKGMVHKLRDVVSNVMAGAENISAASNQMSGSSQEMSHGANEQASSAEEVSSSMEEMTANIQRNNENAQQTEKIAIKAAEGVEEGSKVVDQTVQSMKNIAEKISIIGEIARQTNILALNAAVEAARAGEHGKGFAVVAAEVRKLAERSQVAAAEIDQVSKSSVSVAEKSGKLLTEIVPDIQKTAQLVQEISAASVEQNSGAEQINSAIQQLNQVTQQNAASSEEMATSSEELSSQAQQLLELIAYFKIETNQNFKNRSSFSKSDISHTKDIKHIENNSTTVDI